MIKSILFIYLELFTIRYAKNYSKTDLSNVRQLFLKIISEFDYDRISSYLHDFRKISIFLNDKEHKIVLDFFRYLSYIDKIVNM